MWERLTRTTEHLELLTSSLEKSSPITNAFACKKIVMYLICAELTAQ